MDMTSYERMVGLPIRVWLRGQETPSYEYKGTIVLVTPEILMVEDDVTAAIIPWSRVDVVEYYSGERMSPLTPGDPGK